MSAGLRRSRMVTRTSSLDLDERRSGRRLATGAFARRTLWRAVLTVTGGFVVAGEPPRGGAVVVANHRSHADTAALLAAIPADRDPVVAAAADYWTATPARAAACRALAAGFAVRRQGGGSADLDTAVPVLRAGRVVVVYPEGTRSRDGDLAAFHSGAVRLAAAAGVPLVPAAIAGTARLLPPSGSPRPAAVSVRFGEPLTEATADDVRTAVRRLGDSPTPRPDSRLRGRVAGLAGSWRGVALASVWSVAEAFSVPLLPELPLAVLVLACPSAYARLSGVAAASSVVGVLLAAHVSGAGVQVPQPLVTDRMRAAVAAQVAQEGPDAIRHQPLAGIPVKVYAAEIGRTGFRTTDLAGPTLRARGSRILVVGLLLGVLGTVGRRLRHLYPTALLVVVVGFGAGLAMVVTAWS